ncbi:hypothetical protein, partial [Rhodonellum psychrophilum]|uniref:hypothetical protein n=1 Tax=Rhodonellum psychrophilum TaxID=336828 RepID=UPI00055B3B76
QYLGVVKTTPFGYQGSPKTQMPNPSKFPFEEPSPKKAKSIQASAIRIRPGISPTLHLCCHLNFQTGNMHSASSLGLKLQEKQAIWRMGLSTEKLIQK